MLLPQPDNNVSMKTKYKILCAVAPSLILTKDTDLAAVRAKMNKAMQTMPTVIIGSHPPLASEADEVICGVTVRRFVPKMQSQGGFWSMRTAAVGYSDLFYLVQSCVAFLHTTFVQRS